MCLCVHVSVAGWISREADSEMGKLPAWGLLGNVLGVNTCGAREGSRVQWRDKWGNLSDMIGHMRGPQSTRVGYPYMVVLGWGI